MFSCKAPSYQVWQYWRYCVSRKLCVLRLCSVVLNTFYMSMFDVGPTKVKQAYYINKKESQKRQVPRSKVSTELIWRSGINVACLFGALDTGGDDNNDVDGTTA